MKYISVSYFERQFDKYTGLEQEAIIDTIESIKIYLETGKASYGLRIKRLSPRIYEARISIKLRIAFFKEHDVVKFFCVGTHIDIARCLKHLKSINL